MFYFDPTYIIIIPGLILALWAQASVQSAFNKYGKIPSSYNGTAAQAARAMLSSSGNEDVAIEHTSGTLGDHYDPKKRTLRLSDGVYSSNSIAAIGIAAHEAGHAMQQKDGYPFLKLRSASVPVVNITSNLSIPLFMMGFLLSFEPLITIGIILFATGVLFSLITLPVEFDASRRAIKMLNDNNILRSREEEEGVKKVLRAAAMTYVASAVVALLHLVRLIMLGNRRRRD
ncbi:MAG: zinc metallopeptidase [Christensenellaceae bacterium]|nr:zinc metallopeptidase [Christensenellaceae bacterium]